MNVDILRVGMVVKSMAGHDSGSYYAVLKTEQGFADIADGKNRKVSAPKKKNPLHLQKTNTVIDVKDISDKKLRILLKGIGPSADIAEEE